ncbi:MAG: ketoacyl-ACP synthase III [Bacteroidota bacterium]|nr:ketoacyl-ACP synthase III [Bacteroidota bacterium]
MKITNTIISGTGSYIPTEKVANSAFLSQDFYDEKQQKINSSGEEIIRKFEKITGIKERRYIKDDMKTSDTAAIAAKRAIDDAGIDPESIDQIILAHNYGDVQAKSLHSDMVPSLASRVKSILGIENPNCVAYDILFGCPGWIQGVIQAHSYIKSGMGNRFLVIGAESLSRVNDKYDRDSMIYADGAGATIVEGIQSNKKKGFLSASMRTDTKNEAYYLFSGKSNNPEVNPKYRYIKMHGRKIYEYALSNVPQAMELALERSGSKIENLKKIFIHQANEKMDEAMVNRFYRLYKKGNMIPENIMPMSIHGLGNSSVATIPTLFDGVRKGVYKNQELFENDLLIFASVGAGMNINSFVYRY